MRKTSQDGGDSTSITSGIENEVKKSTTAIAKIKRSSIKKRMQSFSHESDDGVIEPLLQKDKDKTECSSQSAKFSLSKTKTDIGNDKMDDTDKLLPDSKAEKLPISSFSGTSEYLHNGTKDGYKSYSCTANDIHNHMNTNIFNNSDAMKKTVEPKTQILVEIDKQGNFSSGPLIFTTAKIHTDGKNMQMEPVQVTPVPILSTVEGNVIKTSSLLDNKKGMVATAEEEKYCVDNNTIKKSEIASCGKKGSMISSLVETPNYPKVISEEKKIVNNVFNSNPSNLITSTIKISGTDVMVNAASKCTIPNSSVQGDHIFDESSQHSTELKKKQINDKKNMVGNNEDTDVIKKFQLHNYSSSNTSRSKNNSSYDVKTTEMGRIPSSSKTHIDLADYDSKNKINQSFGVTTPPPTTYDSTSSKSKLTLTKGTILQPTVTVTNTNTHSSNDDFLTTVSSTMSTKNKISTAPPYIANTETTATNSNIKTTDGSVRKNTTGIVSSASITNPPGTVSPISLVTKSSVDPKPKTSIKVESATDSSEPSIKNDNSTKISPNLSAKAEDNIGTPIATSLPSEPILTFGKTLSGKTSISTTSTTPLVAQTKPLTESMSLSKQTVPINVSTNNNDKSNSIVLNKMNTSNKSADGSSSKIQSPVAHLVTTESYTSKPSVSVLTKTPQPSVTSTKTSDSTAKITKKPFSSSVSTKIVQLPNADRTKDSQPVTSKAPLKLTPAATISISTDVTTSNQKSSTTKRSSETQAGTTKPLIKSSSTITSPSAGVNTTKSSTISMNKTADNQTVATKGPFKSTLTTVTSASAVIKTTKASINTMNKTGGNQAVTTKAPIKSTPTVTSSSSVVNTTKASTTMNKTNDNQVVTTKAPIKPSPKIPSTSTVNTATGQNSSKTGDYQATVSAVTKDPFKSTTTTTPTTAVTTEIGQKPSTTTNKSMNLQSNEHKKEKLK